MNTQGVDSDQDWEQSGLPGQPPGRNVYSDSREEKSSGDSIKADDLQAKITREQWDHFLETFKPLEDQYREQLGRDIGASANSAYDDSAAASQRMREATARAFQRTGQSITGERLGAYERRVGLDAAANNSFAYNNTFRTESDQRTNDFLNYIALGKDIQTSSSNMANEAAGLFAARQKQGAANKAAKQSALIGGASTIAGAALGAVLL